MSTGNRPTTDPPEEESLTRLLGTRRAALDATLPPVAFVAAWAWSDGSIGYGVTAALVTGAAVAAWRQVRGTRLTAVLLGLLAVAVAALVVLYTGRAADFFLVQLATNALSALVWTGSILLRWPLLGVVVGGVLGQRSRWRRDPALLNAYLRGSWVWVAQYVLRTLVLLPLWAGGHVVALGIVRLTLSWPLVAVCLAASWWVVRRSLPADHPGIRHPRTPAPPPRHGTHTICGNDLQSGGPAG